MSKNAQHKEAVLLSLRDQMEAKKVRDEVKRKRDNFINEDEHYPLRMSGAVPVPLPGMSVTPKKLRKQHRRVEDAFERTVQELQNGWKVGLAVRTMDRHEDHGWCAQRTSSEDWVLATLRDGKEQPIVHVPRSVVPADIDKRHDLFGLLYQLASRTYVLGHAAGCESVRSEARKLFQVSK